MASIATKSAPPPDVAKAFTACPAKAASTLSAIRDLIFDTAVERSGIGPLTETLKWGAPAYLTEKSKSGTTIRLGWDEIGSRVSLYVHCQTTLISEWRDRYPDEMTFVGNREVQIPTHSPLPRAALQHCIAMALTYHSRKTKL
ncbi:MAG: DUF1801 domain-containing protein [Pseudomonadota bacterium]